jgi:hypothetical protein
MCDCGLDLACRNRISERTDGDRARPDDHIEVVGKGNALPGGNKRLGFDRLVTAGRRAKLQASFRSG